MKEIKVGVPIDVNEIIIDVGDDDRGESVFSILMAMGYVSGTTNVTVVPLSGESYVKNGERDSFEDDNRHVERFCFELGSVDEIDYMKIDVTDNGWFINVW